MTMELGEYSRIFTPLFAAIFNLCTEIYGGQYYMEGGIKLLSYPELARDADRLLPYIWESRNVQKLIQRPAPNRLRSLSARKIGAKSCRTARQ